MADKEFPLSIVLRTVDKATAGINAVNKRLDEITRPTREFGKAIGDLAEKSGLKAVGAGFAGVGSAVADVAGKMLMVAGVAGGVVVAFASIVGSFDDLGDKAEALGTSVDFLASMRDAAERSGASVESLDGGLASLSTNMGMLRAGTGKMTAFLKLVSPALATQLKGTKSNEDAFLLLADAMAKIEDPAKRAAFAQKTLGDASLAPLLHRGAKGIAELRGRYAELAGSQKDAAEAAGKVDDSMKDLKAAATGIEAALVQGLAPALGIVVEKLKAWLVDHREDIKRWADDIGKKLPAAIDSVIGSVTKAIGWASSFLDNIGGVKTAALALAAVMVGPMVGAFVTLGITMATTPFGAVLVSLAAISALVISIVGEIDKMNEAMDTSNEKRLQDLSTMTHEQFIAAHPEATAGIAAMDASLADFRAAVAPPENMLTVPKIFNDTAPPLFAQPTRPPMDLSVFNARSDAALGIPAAASTQPQDVHVKVDFMNAPRGTRVAADPQSAGTFDFSVGYQLFGGA